MGFFQGTFMKVASGFPRLYHLPVPHQALSGMLALVLLLRSLARHRRLLMGMLVILQPIMQMPNHVIAELQNGSPHSRPVTVSWSSIG